MTGEFDRSTTRSRARARVSHTLRPTLDSVARAAGVSRQTVSNIFNAPHKVHHDTRRRVEAEIARQGYRPNRSARSLRMRKSGLLGYCVRPPAAHDNPVIDRFIHAMTEAAERHGHHVLLFTSDPAAGQSMIAYEHLLAQQAVDGFVLTDTNVGDHRQQWFSDRRVPFAAFGRRWIEPEVGPWIDVDGAAGVAAAVDHVARLGHHRIAFVGWPEGSGVGDDRCRGFTEAAAAGALSVAGVVRSRPDSLDFHAEGRRLAAGLLASADPPTAILCVSDELALGCDLAIRQLGLRPGRDVAITGFDDTPAAALPAVSLTSIRQPLDAAGEHVVRLLADALGDVDRRPEQQLLEPTLVTRSSTDHPDRGP